MASSFVERAIGPASFFYAYLSYAIKKRHVRLSQEAAGYWKLRNMGHSNKGLFSNAILDFLRFIPKNFVILFDTLSISKPNALKKPQYSAISMLTSNA